MSWRDGGELFWKIWPEVKATISDAELRKDFTVSLMRLFLDFDMDPCEMEGGDPEIDKLLEKLNQEF